MTSQKLSKQSTPQVESPKPSLKELGDRAAKILIANMERARRENPETAPRA
jgi:hypothetical protein